MCALGRPSLAVVSVVCQRGWPNQCRSEQNRAGNPSTGCKIMYIPHDNYTRRIMYTVKLLTNVPRRLLEHCVYGQKTTGQKTTKNANPGHKTTRTKDHQDKRPPGWFFSGEILSHLTMHSFIRERVKNDKK